MISSVPKWKAILIAGTLSILTNLLVYGVYILINVIYYNRLQLLEYFYIYT